jgi:hypothetical protein
MDASKKIVVATVILLFDFELFIGERRGPYLTSAGAVCCGKEGEDSRRKGRSV